MSILSGDLAPGASDSTVLLGVGSLVGVLGVVAFFGGAGLGLLDFGARLSGNLAFGAGFSVMGGVMAFGKVGCGAGVSVMGLGKV